MQPRGAPRGLAPRGRGAGIMALAGLFLALWLVPSPVECTDSGVEKWIPNDGQEVCPQTDQRISVGQKDSSTLRIMLFGKTRVGKSSTGNTILGENLFKSRAGAKSVTKSCAKSSRKWRCRELVVIDTPSLFDSSLPYTETANELGRCIAISSPGPHAIILVLQLGHYSEEEKEIIERLQHIFGTEALRYMIVLFTRKDDLDGESLEDVLRDSEDKDLNKLLETCKNRYCAFNNKAMGREREEQVAELMAMIDRMLSENGGTCFTNDLYIHAEEMITQREGELKKYNLITSRTIAEESVASSFWQIILTFFTRIASYVKSWFTSSNQVPSALKPFGV